MYRVSQMEDLLKCTYPDKVSQETKNKRIADINALQHLVSSAKQELDLSYGVKEERILLFTSHAGEKIYIQYPGKETTNSGNKYRQYDFRPRIITADGTMIIDMDFADMWEVIEEINRQQHQILKLLACIFFRMGRMTLHQRVERDYICDTVNADDIVIGSSTRRLDWYAFSLDEYMESLNHLIETIPIRENQSISFEAFLYFFELILQNEDSKYYDKKGDLSSGRIPTSNSMLLLASYHFGQTTLPVLLQKFVSGNGVANCTTSEINYSTDGLVKIVNRKQDIISFFNENNIVFSQNSSVTVNGESISVTIKTNSPKIVVLSMKSETKRNKLSEKGWMVYYTEDLVPELEFADFLSNYEVDE
ncbi:MAG: hypothetical protein UIH27_18405 [Ruminococcus sp.]|nr:hypothetical protein [Ruminococcus sp.]